MPLLVQLADRPAQANRAGIYARWTARSLVVQLSEQHLAVGWLTSTGDCPAEIPVHLYRVLLELRDSPQTLPITVAKPIGGRPSRSIAPAITR
jgi:hypothetical protein